MVKTLLLKLEILGIYDITTKNMLKVIPNRNYQTLMNEIIFSELPGSEIWIHCWRGCILLKTLGHVSPYVHKTVNHTRKFIDPETETYTNALESNGYLRSQHVLQSKLLPEHIDDISVDSTLWLHSKRKIC